MGSSISLRGSRRLLLLVVLFTLLFISFEYFSIYIKKKKNSIYFSTLYLGFYILYDDFSYLLPLTLVSLMHHMLVGQAISFCIALNCLRV